MEWIIFVDLGVVVAIVAIAVILAAVGIVGTIAWVWPVIRIIFIVIYIIGMIVGVLRFLDYASSDRCGIFTKVYTFLLCAVDAIWSGVLTWIFIAMMTEVLTEYNLIEAILTVILGVPILGACTLLPALGSWASAEGAVGGLVTYKSTGECVKSTLLTAVCIAAPTLIYVYSASHFFSVAKYFPKFIQNIFA